MCSWTGLLCAANIFDAALTVQFGQATRLTRAAAQQRWQLWRLFAVFPLAQRHIDKPRTAEAEACAWRGPVMRSHLRGEHVPGRVPA